MNTTQKSIIGWVAAAGILGAGPLQAYDWKEAQKALSPKQQSIAAAAAFTAVGNLPKLERAFNRGLDEGLAVNELKEVVLQMYAYTGFPRCLNASSVLEKVVRARQAKGAGDLMGNEAQAIPSGTDKYELGKKNLETLTAGKLPSHPAVFIPATDVFLKEHLFADIFARGVLSYQDREIATVAALAALGNVNAQLQAHIGIAMNVGVTPRQIQGIMSVLKTGLGRKTAVNGLKVLEKVQQDREQK